MWAKVNMCPPTRSRHNSVSHFYIFDCSFSRTLKINSLRYLFWALHKSYWLKKVPSAVILLFQLFTHLQVRGFTRDTNLASKLCSIQFATFFFFYITSLTFLTILTSLLILYLIFLFFSTFHNTVLENAISKIKNNGKLQ